MPAHYRYRDTHPVVASVDSATVIEIGELVYQATDDARPADDLAWSTNLAGTQESFHDKFLGCADQRSLAGETTDVRVSTKGTYEFDCAAATFEVGDLVGPADSGSDSLVPTKVVAVAGANLAIGRVAQRYGSNTTRVLVDIVSTIIHGGPQAFA